MLATSLRTCGVSEECLADLRVALSEAVTNVVDHAADGDNYEVVCCIDDDKCVIEVLDRGRGFDAAELGRAEADPDSEAGRGIQLMRRLVDGVQFENRPGDGSVVHLEKILRWKEGAPLHANGTA
jgi:serine/threonine-protein kinase RsbW